MVADAHAHAFAGISDELWRFSTAAGTWELLETPAGAAKPSARGGHAMAAVGDELYLVGGQPDWISDELWRYSTTHGTWELLETPAKGAKPSARSDLAMAAVGSELYLHGGRLSNGGK